MKVSRDFIRVLIKSTYNPITSGAIFQIIKKFTCNALCSLEALGPVAGLESPYVNVCICQFHLSTDKP